MNYALGINSVFSFSSYVLFCFSLANTSTVNCARLFWCPSEVTISLRLSFIHWEIYIVLHELCRKKVENCLKMSPIAQHCVLDWKVWQWPYAISGMSQTSGLTSSSFSISNHTVSPGNCFPLLCFFDSSVSHSSSEGKMIFHMLFPSGSNARVIQKSGNGKCSTSLFFF